MLLLGPHSSGGCRQSPGESTQLLPRGCLYLSTRGKYFSRIITAASPILIILLPASHPRCRAAPPPISYLPALVLTSGGQMLNHSGPRALVPALGLVLKDRLALG